MPGAATSLRQRPRFELAETRGARLVRGRPVQAAPDPRPVASSQPSYVFQINPGEIVDVEVSSRPATIEEIEAGSLDAYQREIDEHIGLAGPRASRPSVS